MTVEQPQKRKPWLVIAVVALLVIAGGVFGVGKYYENKHIQEMKDVIAMVPAPYTLTVGDISGSLFSRNLTLTDVKGSLPYKDTTIEYSMAKVEGESLNPLAFTSDGISKLAGRIHITDIKGSGPNFTYSSASETYVDLEGNFKEIAEQWSVALPAIVALSHEFAAQNAKMLDADGDAWKDNSDEILDSIREHMGSLRGLLKASETLRVGRLASKDSVMTFDIEGQSVSATVNSMEASNYSLTKPGPMKVGGLAVKIDDKQIMAVEEFSMQGAAMASYTEMIELFAQKADDAVLEKFFRENGFSFEALRLKGMTLAIPNPEGEGEIPLVMKDFVMSVSFKEQHFAMALSLDALSFEKKFLVEQATSRSDREMLAMLPDTIVISGKTDMDITQKDSDRADVIFKPLGLSVDGLGSIELGANVLDASASGRSDPSLVSMALSLTDAGASDLIFKILGDDGDEGAEAMRSQVIMMLEMQAPSLQGSLKELGTNLTEFIKKSGGTITLNIAPQKPVGMDELQYMLMSGSEAAGLSSSFTPGK